MNVCVPEFRPSAQGAAQGVSPSAQGVSSVAQSSAVNDDVGREESMPVSAGWAAQSLDAEQGRSAPPSSPDDSARRGWRRGIEAGEPGMNKSRKKKHGDSNSGAVGVDGNHAMKISGAEQQGNESAKEDVNEASKQHHANTTNANTTNVKITTASVNPGDGKSAFVSCSQPLSVCLTPRKLQRVRVCARV